MPFKNRPRVQARGHLTLLTTMEPTNPSAAAILLGRNLLPGLRRLAGALVVLAGALALLIHGPGLLL